MTPEQFWRKASEWATRLRAEEKSRCLFAFDERGLVRDEEHRAACLYVLGNLCLASAIVADRKQDCLVDPVQDEIREMIDYVKTAPVMTYFQANPNRAERYRGRIRSVNSTTGHLHRK